MQGLDHLREMAHVLEAGSGSQRDRVYRAAAAWWEALKSCDCWSEDLRGRAECIIERFDWRGPTFQFVASMNEEDLRQLAFDLHAFARDAGVAPSEERSSRAGSSCYISWPW